MVSLIWKSLNRSNNRSFSTKKNWDNTQKYLLENNHFLFVKYVTFDDFLQT